MKFINDSILETLSIQYGSEPIIVVSVHWSIQFDISNFNNQTSYTDDQIETIINYGFSSNTFGFYADKYIYDDQGNILIPGKLISISEIESSVDFSNNAGTSQVTVTIDDTDNSILGILKVANIHLRPAYVYLYFQGMSLGDMIPIFEGTIVSDFRWSEKTKQVTLNFLSRIEEKEVGFSPEQGYIKDLPLEMIGRPWPFGFGDVVKYPALRINYTPTAILVDPFGIHDYSLDTEISRLEELKKNFSGVAEGYAKAALEAYFSGLKDLGDELTDLVNQVLVIIQQQIEPDMSNLKQILHEQILYEHGLNIQAGTSGHVDVITDVPKRLSGPFQVGDIVVQGSLAPSGQRTGRFTIDKILHPTPGTKTWGNDFFPPSKEDFIFVNSGTPVLFLGKYPLRFLVNALGGTVKGVYAYRTFEGLKRLQPVPKKYWKAISVRTVPPGVVTTVPTFGALVIELIQPLSTLRNEFWEDDLYVSYVSPYGPNIKDILTFLIGFYTKYSIDSRSLSFLPNFNCSFVLPDQKDVMSVIKEICFQCNIAVWTSLGKFYFLYLPQFYFARMIIDLPDIIQDSVDISISPTENIVTKMKGSWRYNYQYDIRNYEAIRYNDDIYGVRSLDVDYYCFQDPSSVMSSMTFWIYRKGNVWKRIKLSLSISFLQLDLFDNVLLTQAVIEKYQLADINPDVSINVLYGSIVSMKINPENWTVELELELPIYVGAKKYSPAYWLSQAGQSPLWKIDEDFQLTETPKQTALYARGFSIDQALSGATLQADFFSALASLTKNTSNGLPSPNSMNGDPEPPGFFTPAVTDVGSRFGYVSPRTSFPEQTKQFAIATQPNWQYAYGTYKIPDQTTSASGGIPGTVDSKQAGKIYNCTVYPNGLSGDGQQVISTQLQLSDKDEIPEGTWAIFVKISNKKAGTDEYYMQVPTWLA